MDEPEQSTDWTVATLLAHIREILLAERRYVEARFTCLEELGKVSQIALDKAISKAEHAQEKRFESVNEFRESLLDQTKNYLTKAEYDSRHVDLERRVSIIERWQSEQGGMLGQSTATRNTIYFVIGSLLNLAMAAGALGLVLFRR